jgi:hypothetical protein
VEYSESETLMAILQDQGCGTEETPEVVTISIRVSSANSLPGSSFVLWGAHSFPGHHLDFLLGYLKYASLGIGHILEVVSASSCGWKVSL